MGLKGVKCLKDKDSKRESLPHLGAMSSVAGGDPIQRKYNRNYAKNAPSLAPQVSKGGLAVLIG